MLYCGKKEPALEILCPSFSSVSFLRLLFTCNKTNPINANIKVSNPYKSELSDSG